MKSLEYGMAEFDRKSGTVESYIGLPVGDVGGHSVPRFLESAAQHGWELCGTMPGPLLKEAKVPHPPSHGGLRTVEDVNEVTCLIFKREK